MGRVGLVCDSTCDLDPAWLASKDIRLVPLKVLFGDESYLDWIDLAPEAFYDKLLASGILPKTSQPSPADFSAVYEQLAEEGCTEIVSIHLTSALSGTCESAHIAAREAPVPIRVVDTKLVTQAVALVIKAALAVRDTGGSAEDVERVANDTASSTQLFFILDTLDYLVKGGRAGKAAGLAASVLSIKPVLMFNAEGTIEPFKKVKGLRKALTELATHVAEDSRKGRVRVAILHACTLETAQELRAALEAAGADFELDSIGLVGSVIGTYAGPGAVGLAYHPL